MSIPSSRLPMPPVKLRTLIDKVLRHLFQVCCPQRIDRAGLIRIINSHHSKEFFRSLWITTIARGKVWRGKRSETARKTARFTGWTPPYSHSSTRPENRRSILPIRTDITSRKASEAQILTITEREQMRIGTELHEPGWASSSPPWNSCVSR